MTAVEAKPFPLSQAGLVKMEDRKRPSPYDHNDSAPPTKKVATSANGAGKSNHDADMPWKDDLEVSNHLLQPFVLTTNTPAESIYTIAHRLEVLLMYLLHRGSKKMQSTGKCRSTGEKRTQ
jgi:hypothetical protein